MTQMVVHHQLANQSALQMGLCLEGPGQVLSAANLVRVCPYPKAMRKAHHPHHPPVMFPSIEVRLEFLIGQVLFPTGFLAHEGFGVRHAGVTGPSRPAIFLGTFYALAICALLLFGPVHTSMGTFLGPVLAL